ncbi:transposase [Plakobranchus ocellatus]|uniref:Transposase n=1 Tax=Plakobranchus ocellatus TaxID=259542 RepID=A0AAV4AV41_9GAST|nr:transposase [Plakobranchus ocellatus]
MPRDDIQILWVNPPSSASHKTIHKEHDNATPHSANLTQQWLQRYGLEILPHSAHSPDLAPSDFHLFGPLKRHLGGMAFEIEDDFIGELRIWFDNLEVDFFRGSNEGEWHVVKMPYLHVFITSDSGLADFLYGVDLQLTCEGHFGFNYRAISKKLKKSFKTHSSGQMQITPNIWIGNHAAALNSSNTGYDCLLNASDDAPVHVMKLNRPMILRKFNISSGVDIVISDETLHKAVRWLYEANKRCTKILVFSKYGDARAASIIIAYIYAKNPDLTFEEAVKFVDSRCPVSYHKGLKSTVARLYPRT